MSETREYSDRIAGKNHRTPPTGFASIRTRFMAFTLACGLFTAATVGGFAFFEFRSVLKDQAIEKLADETRLMAVLFANAYRDIENDLRLISEAKPVQAIIRAIENNGVDPLDGTSLETLASRLSVIFSTALRNRPEYFQFRMIGMANEGKELVRVERTDLGVAKIDPVHLQRKAGEDYFKVAQSSRANSVAFSQVTYNREHGKIDSRGIPTLRGILPLDDKLGRRAAFLVVNINYEDMLRAAFSNISSDNKIIAVNGNGDYMVREPNARSAQTSKLQMKKSDGYVPEAIVAAFLDIKDQSGPLPGEDVTGYFIRDTDSFNQQSAKIGLIQIVPTAALYENAKSLGNELLIAGLFILSVCAIVIAFVGDRFIQPLLRLARLIQQNDPNDLVKVLPEDRKDELGYLAAAIKDRSQELIDKEAESANIINRILDGIIVIDQDGVIRKFSPGAEEIFGYSAEEVVGLNVGILMHDDAAFKHDDYVREARNISVGRQPGAFRELEGVRKDGSTVPIELCVNTLIVNGKQKFLGVVRDISHRKEIDRMRDEFVSTVSHELRTPLTTIRGSLVLADKLAKASSLPETVTRMLHLAAKNTDRLSLLVNDILDLEKLRSGKFQFFVELLNLNDEVRVAAEMVREQAADRNIVIDVSEASSSVFVVADRTRLQQVLANLLSNAIKFSFEHGTIDLRVSRFEGLGRISVTDAGCGIPKDYQPHVSDPFSQADSSNSREKGGTGLGLCISKKLMDGMEGSIRFASEEGVGTTFTLEFEEQENTDMLRPVGGFDGRDLCGLHLEDDADFAEVLCASLNNDVTYVHETTLEGARARLKERKFDFIIIDIDLNSNTSTGLDLLDDIPDPRNTVVVVLSGREQELDHPAIDAVLLKSATGESDIVSIVVGFLAETKKLEQGSTPRLVRSSASLK